MMTRQNRSLYWVNFMFGSAWLILVALRSPDAVFLDELAHVLMSRNAWQYPSFFLDTWGRPFNTLIYAIPALGGMALSRWFSVGMALLVVWLTTLIAQKVGVKRLWIIPIALFFQPWFAEMMFTANTMTPFALLLIAGVYLWMIGRWKWASLLFGLLPLTRHEGVALTVIWAGYCLIRRKPLASGVSFAPLGVYNLLYYLTYGMLASGNLFDAQPTTFYGAGGWFHYLPAVAHGVGVVLLLVGLLGIRPMFRHPLRVIFIPFMVYLVVHVVIYRYGLFASGGYRFFLVPTAPAFAILAGVGIERFMMGVHFRQRNFMWTLGGIVIVLYAVLTTFTHPLSPRTQALEQASAWMKANEADATEVLSGHVWFVYFYDLAWSPQLTDGWVRTGIQLDQLAPETIVVWEGHFSERFGIAYDRLTESDEWQVLQEFGEGTHLVVLFKKDL